MNVVDCHGCGLKRYKIIECSTKHNTVNLKRILKLEEENQGEIKQYGNVIRHGIVVKFKDPKFYRRSSINF